MILIQVRADDRVVEQLTRIANNTNRIGEVLMALKEELTALIAAFDTATNSVAAEIAKLKQQIADALSNPNALSDADKAAIEAGLQAQVDRLTTLGQDPANPVPPEPPPPPPTPPTP